jgi:tyrosine-protein phosphatase SIW14
MKINIHCLRIALLFSLTPICARAGTVSNTIPNFQTVEGAVYRGGTPGASGVEALKQMGVKTILNLDNNSAESALEKKAAEAAGIRWISVPMSGFWQPKDATMNKALTTLADSSLRPIFVHCKHGEDRTGLAVGLYRVEYEHWQPAQAYEEMKTLGFHPLLVFLNHYFESRTGFED